MASGPKKQAASQGERDLYTQSIRDINEANKVLAAAQDPYLARVSKDNTQKLLNRANADANQATASMKTGNVLADLGINRAGATAEMRGATNARQLGKQDLDNKRLNALRVGKGMATTAQSGTSALAQTNTNEILQDMQRDAQKESNMISSVATLAMLGGMNYANNDGIFANGTLDISTGQTTGRGWLGSYGAGNNGAKLKNIPLASVGSFTGV